MPMGAGTGGTSGSTTGLRYNPRQTAGDEVGYGVSHTKYNPRDPEDKERETEDKREAREKRDKAKAGLQHLKVKVKNAKREREEAEKEAGMLSDLTGPAASRGGDLDQAIGAMSGTGSAMGGGPGAVPVELPTMGAFGQGGAFVRAFEVLKDDEPGRFGRTDTIESVRAQERGRKGARKRRDKTIEGEVSRRGKRQARAHFRDPRSRDIGHSKQRVYFNPRQQTSRRTLSHLYRGPRHPHASNPDPRQAEQKLSAQAVHAQSPKLPYVPPTETVSHASRAQVGRPKTARPRRPAIAGPKKITAPKTASTPMGAKFGTGPSSALAMSEDVMEISDLILKFGFPKGKLRQADIAEFKQMLREVKRLLAGLKKGYDGEGEDGEKPSPNAHRKQTSAPTGATETDDDWGKPQEWGVHPYGLYVGRRGQP